MDMTPDLAPAQASPVKRGARTFMVGALCLQVVTAGLLAFMANLTASDKPLIGPLFAALTTLVLAQLASGVAALVMGIKERRATGGARGLWPAIVGLLMVLTAIAGWLLGCLLLLGASLLDTGGWV